MDSTTHCRMRMSRKLVTQQERESQTPQKSIVRSLAGWLAGGSCMYVYEYYIHGTCNVLYRIFSQSFVGIMFIQQLIRFIESSFNACNQRAPYAHSAVRMYVAVAVELSRCYPIPNIAYIGCWIRLVHCYYCYYYDSCSIAEHTDLCSAYTHSTTTANILYIAASHRTRPSYRQHWIFCLVFTLVNCWLHAKQHRLLYGPVYHLVFFSQLCG